MKNKLLFLTKMSLKKKMASKWFIVVNLIVFIALVGIINIDSIIAAFGGDFNENIQLVVIDETEEVYPTFQSTLSESQTLLDETSKFEITLSKRTVEEEQKSLENTNNVLLVFKEDPNDYLKSEVISESTIDQLDYQVIVQALTTTKSKYALANSDIDVQELQKISSPIEIERIILDDSKKSEEENMSIVMSTVFPIVILPFFMLTIFLVQMIGAEISEEKTTRSMEIIISNVSPTTHFASKVLAAITFVIAQGALLFAYAALGLVIKSLLGSGGIFTDEISSLWSSLVHSGFTDQLIYIIPLTLILMLLSFLAYALIAGILASMTVNMEDFQQIQTPIMIVLLLGYYLAIMSSMFEGSLFIRILSYIPLLSSVLSPALLVAGQITILDVVISIVILVLFNGWILRHGMRVYKAGILNYSNEKVWSRLKNAVNLKR